MGKRTNIGSRLHSVERGNVVAGANEILDDTKGKKQNVINADVDAELLRLDQSKQNNLTFDNTPTENSNNPVKSSGVYAADKALSDAIDAILILIPSAATALNQLADKNFVNSSIATDTATFRGTSETGLSEAQFLEWANGLTHDMNDYVFWQTIDEAGNTLFKRYKWNGTQWLYEYTLNNSSFTADQWAAIMSGITSALVEKLNGLPTNTALQQALNSKQDTLTFDNVPTENSNNPVKSGGVYSAVKSEEQARQQLAGVVDGIAGDVSDIEDVIPTGATEQNQLVANSSMEAYVASIIQNITASFTLATTDGHINLTLTQVNGQVATLTLASSDIASAQALTALTGRVTTAEGNITSLTGRVSTNETEIANLQQLYNDLQQSKPVPVTALPETGQQQGVIYRLAGTTSYSDYMWNGSTWVLMATYNNAIDPRPKKASQNLVTSGGVFDNMGALDVSELNATENPHTLAQYNDLSAALAAIPTDYQKGGMSVKFVCSVDNKYVQYRLMADTFSTTESDWQGVDDVPTVGSDNLVKSGGVASMVDGVIVAAPSKWGLGREVVCRMASALYISMNGYTARLVPINGGETIFAKGNSNGGAIAVVKTFSASSEWTTYDFASGEDEAHDVPENNSTTFVCPSDAKLLIVKVKDDDNKDYVPAEFTINGIDAYNDTPSKLSLLEEKVENLEDVVYDKEHKWCGDDDFNNVIEEFYVKNASTVLGTGSYIYVIGISDAGITIIINNSSNTEILRVGKDFNGAVDSNPDGAYDYYFGRKGKAAITTLYKKNPNNSLLERIGYIKFKDTTFAKTNTGTAVIDTSIVGNIDNSPMIKAMINDGRQLVLSGDSHFGAFKAQNILQDLLQGLLGIQVYNIGFGGCRMAWRSNDGSDNLDPFSFSNVVDAIISGVFTSQEANVDESDDFPPSVANMEAIDTSKPMQFLVEYVVNDHTGNSPIGDIYEDDGTFDVSDASQVTAKLSTFDRTTLLGALNYGLLKLYANKPRLMEVQVTGGARVIDDPDVQGRRMRYNKQNSLGKTLDEYNEALKNDCNNIGIRYADYPNNGLYNAFAMRQGDEGITTGGSIHNNALGFCYMSKVIALMSRYYLG